MSSIYNTVAEIQANVPTWNTLGENTMTPEGIINVPIQYNHQTKVLPLELPCSEEIGCMNLISTGK
jgi:hypothetical protein